VIHPTRPEEADGIRRLAAAEPLFNAQERLAVAELLHDYLERPDHNGYFFLSALDGPQLAGFACYGPKPLTQGTFDLYWIAVDRGLARRGVGRALMQAVEEAVRRQGGRLLLVETSGRPDYAPTRAFYEAVGYRAGARIADFYAPGDDLVIYLRDVSGPEPAAA
jgi:ribosomal protein S18 acetylase RimI-like enzyme